MAKAIRAERRLEIYRRLVEVYSDPKEVGKTAWDNPYAKTKTHGICGVLISMVLYGLVNHDEYSIESYPELMKQRPDPEYVEDSLGIKVTGFWWKPGSIEPRLNAIRKALELCEEQLKNKET